MSLESNGEFQSLFDLSPEEYYGCVYTINENRKLTLQEMFQNAPINPQTDAVIVTGSDGKSERHTQSKTEMTLLIAQARTDASLPLNEWYRKRYHVDMGQHYDVDDATGLPEVKVANDDVHPLAYAFDNNDLVYPDRILNSQLIVGNEELLHNAKKQVLSEITADGPEGNRMRNEMETQLRGSMKSLTTGQYRRGNIFTLEPPEQYYDEDMQNYSVGFKVAGIRPLQRMADLLTIRAIRNGKLSIDDASVFPTNTVARVESLAERGLTPDISDVVPAYQWFLQQYHVVQDKYKSARQGVRVPFKPEEFLHHRNAVLEFRGAMKHM